MFDTYSTRRALMLGVLFSFWAIHIVQTDAFRNLRILPEVEKDEQINEEGTTLTLTCIGNDFNQYSKDIAEKIKWNLPLSETEAEAGVDINRQTIKNRLNITTFKNETHGFSKMTLVNLTLTDTGNYRCEGPIRLLGQDRFVYVSSTRSLFSFTFENHLANELAKNPLNNDNSRTISFVTTHPNVSISIFKQGTEPNPYLEVWNSSNKNSRWSFDPRKGLTLKNPTVFDSAYYFVFGRLPFVNGKPVNITMNFDAETEETILRYFPMDRIEAIQVQPYSFVVPGIQVERVGAPDDPVEGSNVTLICTSFSAPSALTSKINPSLTISLDIKSIDPPTWFYYANRNETWQKLSKDFFKEPNADIRNEIEETPDGFYKRKLNLINVTLNTSYTKFKCAYSGDNSTVKEIAFTIKEIDNKPLSNSIALEKGVDQNLICNRLSQQVPIHWLKDGMAHSDLIYENETASIVLLQGKEKEKGIYECRWKNSKGEPRHRNFTVNLDSSFKNDEKDTSAIIVSARMKTPL